MEEGMASAAGTHAPVGSQPPAWVNAVDHGRVDKPWGYELRWVVADAYVGKMLHINRGHALSLQYHNVKDEAIFVVSGCVEVALENDGGVLESFELQPGMSCRILPLRKHRFTAIEDSDVFEASTTELDDVVRLEDRYGREGTTEA